MNKPDELIQVVTDPGFTFHVVHAVERRVLRPGPPTYKTACGELLQQDGGSRGAWLGSITCADCRIELDRQCDDLQRTIASLTQRLQRRRARGLTVFLTADEAEALLRALEATRASGEPPALEAEASS